MSFRLLLYPAVLAVMAIYKWEFHGTRELVQAYSRAPE